MSRNNSNIDKLIHDLQERTRELNCIFRIEEVLNNSELTLEEMMNKVIHLIPTGWQYPELCKAQIKLNDQIYQTNNFKTTSCIQKANIIVQGEKVGRLSVCYLDKVSVPGTDVFLVEEEKLIKTIADRIGHTVLHGRLRNIAADWKKLRESKTGNDVSQWRVILNLLLQTDQKLYIFLARKMLHYLYLQGITETGNLIASGLYEDGTNSAEDMNRPLQKSTMANILKSSEKIFQLAAEHFSDERILTDLQHWIQEDRSRFLVKAIEDPNSRLTAIIEAISRYRHSDLSTKELTSYLRRGIIVSLIRHFFSEQLEFISAAKECIRVTDFYDVTTHMIYSSASKGKLGGKSAGIFLAKNLINQYTDMPFYNNIKFPKSWYITSDTLIEFLYYNNLEEVNEQKYKDIDVVNIEYPNIVQMFKISEFPPRIIKGLSEALEDIGDKPIIIRSSSLLEDRFGATFSGKYKSLFLANRGSKKERLDALKDAIAEVYASTFAPDPIEYRRERDLVDFYEEMAILIQEVVGTKVGPYFFPLYAGVAYSSNEFRWSPRISREDGLIRIVPGLGTRAVDRVADDFPILLAPSKPGLSVNITLDEVIRYSPKSLDVINLEKNCLETILFDELLKKYGNEMQGIQHVISKLSDDNLTTPNSTLNIDFEQDTLITTFDGLIKNTDFVGNIDKLLKMLQRHMGRPVDIEFASDGKDLYLLQCRAQGSHETLSPTPIPRNIKVKDIIFKAKRFVSNGNVPDITHIVYVSPAGYRRLSDLDILKQVGKTVGKLNGLLPKRQFILMGPGRWGSRGDVTLGVSVTYADINNTAMLIEIAKKTGHYTPDLSFGTHFFQDLVEASIRYLPLYPDQDNTILNESFLTESTNELENILPEAAFLNEIIHVIDVQKNAKGKILRIALNAEQERALAWLAPPSGAKPEAVHKKMSITQQREDHWQWRNHMAEYIASQLDAEKYGAQGYYLFGSTKNATAGPASDINIIIHIRGTEQQKHDLLNWLEGWNLALSEFNYLKTGFRTDNLLDIHLVTDEDITNKTKYASKMKSVTNPARSFRMMKK